MFGVDDNGRFDVLAEPPSLTEVCSMHRVTGGVGAQLAKILVLTPKP